MAPANLPLQIRVGDTETVSVTILDENEQPVDITGRSYAAQIRTTTDASTALATFTCAIVSGPAGTLTATLSSATTAALTPGLGVWDLQETNPIGPVVITLLAGPVTIVQDVTRT
jgi:hypothetical protein